MTYYHKEGVATVLHGDCLNELRELEDNSVHAVVTDPPYGLSNTTPAQVAETITRWVSGERDYLPSARGFMGHEWDGFVPPVAVWDECLRVLKPGGHLLAFAGSRTHDLMGLAVRLAGFEIRDSVAWLYGSGFPKSMDVSKAIDKAAGAEREVIGFAGRSGSGRTAMDAGTRSGDLAGDYFNTAPATPDAARWQGWGTALKPAHEPIILARKPLTGTVAANVLEHGTGALNIDVCRIGMSDADRAVVDNRSGKADSEGGGVFCEGFGARPAGERFTSDPSGRWPANVVLDESQAAELDRQSGDVPGAVGMTLYGTGSSIGPTGLKSHGKPIGQPGQRDKGGASRFFYVAKAPKSERPVVDGVAHPTVKPVTLMRWLVRMVTPPGGTVLDPFAGSGTTLEAAVMEDFNVIGIEREADYLPLIRARLERAVAVKDELTSFSEPPAKPGADDPTPLF